MINAGRVYCGGRQKGYTQRKTYLEIWTEVKCRRRNSKGGWRDRRAVEGRKGDSCSILYSYGPTALLYTNASQLSCGKVLTSISLHFAQCLQMEWQKSDATFCVKRFFFLHDVSIYDESWVNFIFIWRFCSFPPTATVRHWWRWVWKLHGSECWNDTEQPSQ